MRQDDADFPTLFGTCELIEHGDADADLRHVRAYIAMSIRVWPLIEEDPYDAEATKQGTPSGEQGEPAR